MKNVLTKIIGFTASSAFLFTAALNSNLVYNKTVWNEQPAKFDARLVEMHTNKQNGEFYVTAKTRNYVNLDRFFGLVK